MSALKRLAATILLTGLVLSSSTGFTQQKSRIADRSLYQAMLDGNKENGWISFRNSGGKQRLYFSALQTLHCRLKEIRYSINNTTLDQRFPLVKCNPQNPFALPSDARGEDILVVFKLGTIGYAAVQVVWEDDSKSEMAVYEPCTDVGDQNCAWLLK